MLDHSGALDGVIPVTCHDKEGSPFTIRALEARDLPALETFYENFEPKRAAQGLPPIGLQRIRSWLGSVLPDGVHLIAEIQDEPIGHALLMPTGRNGVWEYAIFVGQDCRKRGMGTAINRVAVAVARALAMRKLWLSVEPHNRAAIRSYQKVGFRFLPSAMFSPEAEMELAL